MTTGKYGANWITQDEEYPARFTEVTLNKSVKFILSNRFIFQQVIGIPMGSDYAPVLRKLFIYYYESEWIIKIAQNESGGLTTSKIFLDSLVTYLH